MSILIKGMEMPTGKDVLTVAITADGEVYSIGFDNTIEGGIFLSHPSTYPIQAVPVPPHGRLIDADALKKNAYPFPCAIGTEWAVTLRQINDAPTIIPASEEGE